MDILAAQDWQFPVPIAYGPGRLVEIGARAQTLGLRNPLIVTDKGSRDLPFIAKLAQSLSTAGLNHAVFSAISPNPRDDEIAAGCLVYRNGLHDAVIAIGGGSAMDGGKAIALTATSGADLWDFEYESPDPIIEVPFPTLITVPTTAGTGAETESTAMVTHLEKGMKFCIWHPDLKPTFAVLDPDLTRPLPRTLTAWTGVDAMVHAIEAYLVPDFHPMCDGLALEALDLINRWLPIAVAEPENTTARGGMLVGSCLAGVAFLKGLGLVHSISHMIGAEFDTHHGLTNAIILPVVLDYNLAGQPDKTARLAQTLGLDDTSPKAVIGHITQLLDQLEIPRSLAEIGVPEDCAPRIAAKALQDSATQTNPRSANLEEMTMLTLQAIRSAR